MDKETVLNFNLQEFKKQKEQLQKHATQEVAKEVAEIKKALVRIKEFIEVSGIVVNLSYLLRDVQDCAELHPDWNTSSFECGDY